MRHWPVRWRLAAVSAALTLVILVAFAFLIGRLAGDQIRSDFHDELQSAAGEIALAMQVVAQGGQPSVRPQLDQAAMADAAAIRVVSGTGEVIEETPGSADLGRPVPGIATVGELKVASAPVSTTALGAPEIFVQYARDYGDMEATVDRLWLFLGGGVLAGTLLAALAGLAVAGRAMRPISALTATAREIASTRDPSRSVPQPGTDDEIAELAQTLDEMLHALDAARSETEQMIEAQREFVADASHELRTPLTSILANLELLQASLAEEGGDRARNEHREVVEGALRSSRRMSRLVSDLLILARADAGRAAPRRRCDLAEIASAAAAEARPIAGEHPIELESDEPVPVEGNPDELHRMASNLIDNAIRHTPKGTRVTVQVARRDHGAVLDVSDDGPGIPGGLEEQIFGRFVRGSGPADRAGKPGAGLGLAIVRAVASSHGGTVRAGSSRSGGARFTVELPLEPAPRREPVSVPA
jgi:two-component system OmpR family sensor kinase